jgi:hypothetical protein
VHKLPKYATAGVAHCWLIDPSLRTVQVLRNERNSWVVAAAFSAEDRAHAEPFEAFALELDRIFVGG